MACYLWTGICGLLSVACYLWTGICGLQFRMQTHSINAFCFCDRTRLVHELCWRIRLGVCPKSNPHSCLLPTEGIQFTMHGALVSEFICPADDVGELIS